MRTTIDIDDDVLQAARELAAAEKTTAGKVLSRFFRKGLHAGGSDGTVVKNGVPVLRSRNRVVTRDILRKIMDEQGI